MIFEIDNKKLYVIDGNKKTTFNRDVYDWYRKDSSVDIFVRYNSKIVLKLKQV